MQYSEILQLLKSEGLGDGWTRSEIHTAIGYKYLEVKYPLGGAEDRQYDELDVRRAVARIRLTHMLGGVGYRLTGLYDELINVVMRHDIGIAWYAAETASWSMFADDIPRGILSEEVFVSLPCYIAALDPNTATVEEVLDSEE